MNKPNKLLFTAVTAVFILLLIFAPVMYAQTPQYYNFAINENTNYFPFGATASMHEQFLYPAGNLNTPTPAPPGNITKIYFYMGFTNGNATLTQLTFKMGQASLTSLPTGAYYTGQLDTVYYRASVNLTSTIGAWMSITLDHPFAYDTSKALILDISQCGATNNTVVVAQHNYTGFIRRSYSLFTTPCPNTYYGQDAQAANFGVDISTVLPNGWVAQTSGTTNALNTVSAVSDMVGWVGGNAGVVLRTTNGGNNWTNVTGAPIGSGDAVYAICGIDANTCLVSTSPSATYVFKTTNGGANWTQTFNVAGGFVDDIKMFNATNGFLYGDPVGGRWELYKTTNAGSTWDSTGLYLPQAGSEAGWNNAMDIIGNNIWFGTNNTKVYYSTNAGTSWLSGATTGTVNGYSVAFNTGGIGFTGQTIAVKSTNGGANWASFTVPGTGTIFGFNNIMNEFWYGRGNIIYFSSDNGGTFAMQYTNPTTSTAYNATSFVLVGNTIRGWAVTSTGLISRYNETVTGIKPNTNEIPSEYALSQNYPNPFNPTTKISFSLPKASNVKITVFDMLGREITTLVNDFRTAGKYDIDFNASSYASGVYLYRLDAGDFTAVKKMVLVK